MDTNTVLLTVIGLIAATASLTWFVVALPLAIAPRASLRFGVANALFALSVLLTLQRTAAPNWWFWPVADLLGLAAFIEMHLGTRQLFKLPDLWRPYLGMGVVLLALFLSAEPGMVSSWRYGVVYSFAAALVMALIAADCFRAARSEFNRTAGFAVAWPFAVIALVMLLRGVLISFQHPAISATPVDQSANVDDDRMMWLYTFLVLLLNISLFGSVLTRLVMKVRNYAERDHLTGLLNRRAFDRRLAIEQSRVQRNDGAFALLLLDVDHFKQINDVHGHAGGDMALRHVSQVLASGLRPSDVLARQGGEEFIILLPDTELSLAMDVAERLRSALENTPLLLRGRTLSLHASFGVASSRQGSDDSLLKRADHALYAAKSAGRNRCVAAPDELPLRQE